MEFLSQLPDYGGWLAGVVAGFVALGWLLRKAWRGYRKFDDFLQKADAVLDIAEYELQHNGGGSIKDAAAQVPKLRQEMVDFACRFETHLEQATNRDQRLDALEAQTLASLAEAMPIVARSVPHPVDAHLPDHH